MSNRLLSFTICFFICSVRFLCATHIEQKSWLKLAHEDIMEAIKVKPIHKRAKNIILFVGDGMSPTTLVTSRILKGQLDGRPGEEGYLDFERFPYSAQLKTYNVDRQIGDSAATATAYLSGVKANTLTVGVDEKVLYDNCSSYSSSHDTKSMLMLAIEDGKEAGIVTTTSITNGSPAAVYAHSSNRFWESDVDVVKGIPDKSLHPRCPDIASQFVSNALDLRLVFGGGRQFLTPIIQKDVEYPNKRGVRKDGKNLINEWKRQQIKRGRSIKYVWNKEQFEQLNTNGNEYILGLFEPKHMQWDIERDNSSRGEPSISEMTRKSIEILSKSNKGYVLFVEGGRIDHAHHDNQAKRALTEVLALERAVKVAMEMTSEKDTLIMVTADHSHVFTFGAAPSRGRDIFAITDFNVTNLAPGLAYDGLPFTSLMYMNGPNGLNNTLRRNITNDNLHANDYQQTAMIKLPWETHGGEDVSIFARGPMAHLFHRVHEQNYVATVAMYASCIGPYSGSSCELTSTALRIGMNYSILICAHIIFIKIFIST